MKEHIWMSKLKAMNNKENKWSNSKRSCRYLVFQKLFRNKTHTCNSSNYFQISWGSMTLCYPCCSMQVYACLWNVVSCPLLLKVLRHISTLVDQHCGSEHWVRSTCTCITQHVWDHTRNENSSLLLMYMYSVS